MAGTLERWRRFAPPAPRDTSATAPAFGLRDDGRQAGQPWSLNASKRGFARSQARTMAIEWPPRCLTLVAMNSFDAQRQRSPAAISRDAGNARRQRRPRGADAPCAASPRRLGGRPSACRAAAGRDLAAAGRCHARIQARTMVIERAPRCLTLVAMNSFDAQRPAVSRFDPPRRERAVGTEARKVLLESPVVCITLVAMRPLDAQRQSFLTASRRAAGCVTLRRRVPRISRSMWRQAELMTVRQADGKRRANDPSRRAMSQQFRCPNAAMLRP